MTVVGLIPARGGSKRVPRKNLAECAGKPLLAWTAEGALAAHSLDRVMLSTDNEEIAALGRSLGVEVPELRPASIADDGAPMLPVMQHALDVLERQSAGAEIIVLLQPTSPLRRAVHIDEAVRLLLSNAAETVVSVVAVPSMFHPMKVLKVGKAGLETYLPDAPEPGTAGMRLPAAYGRNGPAVLATRAAVIRRGKLYGEPCLPYEMTLEDSIDINDRVDLDLAAWFLNRRASASSPR